LQEERVLPAFVRLGYVAAVRWLTDPSFARQLVPRLEQSAGGKMPRYYQVLLEVKFKDNVPTETTYVLSRIPY